MSCDKSPQNVVKLLTCNTNLDVEFIAIMDNASILFNFTVTSRDSRNCYWNEKWIDIKINTSNKARLGLHTHELMVYAVSQAMSTFPNVKFQPEKRKV